jgi:hypothetical protein
MNEALTKLDTLEEKDRSTALEGIISGACDDGLRKDLLDRFESLSPEVRDGVLSEVACKWAISDPDGATQWVRSKPAEEQLALRESIGRGVMAVDPERGADFQMEGVSEKNRAHVMNIIIADWSRSDLRGAGEWLARQSQGPELDDARGTYARTASRRDPAAAMDWAMSITAEAQRASSVVQVYNAWKKKDAAAADAALNASGLSQEQIQKAREGGAD